MWADIDSGLRLLLRLERALVLEQDRTQLRLAYRGRPRLEHARHALEARAQHVRPPLPATRACAARLARRHQRTEAAPPAPRQCRRLTRVAAQGRRLLGERSHTSRARAGSPDGSDNGGTLAIESHRRRQPGEDGPSPIRFHVARAP